MLIFGLLYLLSVKPGTQQADLKDNEVLNAKSNELIIARYFTQGKNYLNLSYDEELKDVVRNVNLNKNQVDIVGYADARGSRIYNLNLANMRAFNTLKSLGDIGLDLSLVNNIDIKVPKDSANCQRFNNCNNYMKVEILIQKKSNLNQ